MYVLKHYLIAICTTNLNDSVQTSLRTLVILTNENHRKHANKQPNADLFINIGDTGRIG